MPSITKHITLSKERTGKDYRELHEWMDPWTTNKPLGRERHEITNIPQHLSFVRERWGDEGVKEFLHHIKDDYECRPSLGRYGNNFIIKTLRKMVWLLRGE